MYSNSPAGWRVPRAAFHSLNGIQTHSQMYMYSPAGWRVPRAPLSLNGIQTHSQMFPQLGGEFRALYLVLVYFHVPRLRFVNELGASVRFVGNHATQVARVPCVHPLETWVQRVEIMWCRNSDWVSIYRRWFVLSWPRGLWLFSSRGCILSRALNRKQVTVYLKNKWLKDQEHLFAKEIYLSCPIKRKNSMLW